MIKIDKETAQGLMFDDLDDDSPYKIVESGEWMVDGKYSYMIVIFSFNDKFYQLNCSRHGSYHTDYYYMTEDETEFECSEVEKKEVSVTQWIIKR